MNEQNWEKIKNLFAEVSEQPKEIRAEYLRRACGGDKFLFDEINSLLEAHEETRHLIEKKDYAAATVFEQNGSANYAGKRFGNYKILREIGYGGMGAVFLAERDDGEFDQQIALKIVRRTIADRETERHFLRERQILARLNHPNISRLLDGGVSRETGEPFLAMEYIAGEPLLEYAEKENLEIEDRLRLFLKVCDAVSYAHQNFVIHRDIKPSNILVDRSGEPKLLDFGLAKIFDENLPDASKTETAFRAFTPAYASPEQIRGENISTASDVYSLGAVFYELLTGERPFNFENKSYEEILRSINTKEPPRPSTAVSIRWSAVEKQSVFDRNKTSENSERTADGCGIKTNPRSKIQNLKSLRGDLDNIALMALRRDAERRYQSVEQFAEDIRRHLKNLPVSARPLTFSYRAAKFISRNRLAVSAFLLIFLTLCGGIIATVRQARRAEANQVRAEKRFADVRGLANALLYDIAPKIEQIPGSIEARQSLIGQSLKYLDGLAGEAQDDLNLQAELAAAYEKIGDLQSNPSNPNFIESDAAIENYKKAQAIRLNLLEKKTDDFQWRRGLAENYRVQGKIYGQTNDFQTETENLETALRIYEQMLAENPESRELKFSVAQTNYDIGRNRSSWKNYSEAFRHFERAIAALESLRTENPQDIEVIKQLGECRTDYGNALSWDGKQPEAEAEATRAINLLETAVVAAPNDSSLRKGLWFAYWLSSSTYEEQNDALAHRYAEKALQIMEEIVRQDAGNIRAKQFLSKSLSTLGQTLINTGKPEEAIITLEKARRISQEIIESRTKNNGLKHDLTTVLMRLGEAKLDQRKFREALADFEQAAEIHLEILQNLPDDTRTARNLAVTYESIAETHKKIGGEESATARENYRKVFEILSQLEAQNALGEFDRKFLEKTRAMIRKYEEKK